MPDLQPPAVPPRDSRLTAILAVAFLLLAIGAAFAAGNLLDLIESFRRGMRG
jgi:hypothetical protein